MKSNKSLLFSFVILVLLAALYRLIPNRIPGFAPQIAIALFGGSIISNKKFAFLLPLASMLLSDCIFEILYINQLAPYKGFYDGQLFHYSLYFVITLIGSRIQFNKLAQIAGGSLAGVLFFYLASNLSVWMGGGLDINNQAYTLTFADMIRCLTEGIPFLKTSMMATIVFNVVLFGGYNLLQQTRFANLQTKSVQS